MWMRVMMLIIACMNMVVLNYNHTHNDTQQFIEGEVMINIEWRKDTLVLLDQTKLPTEITYVHCTD